ncbi:MAG: hypothetical protein HC830_00350 [Bacteroidetes bacterium]|nr:hypothetical protein [Bacteroidota bacterium]
MKKNVVLNFKMTMLKVVFSFICLTLFGNNVLSQSNPDRKRDADPDTAWVSPNKSTPSFASYQLYPTPARGKDTYGSFMIYLPPRIH